MGYALLASHDELLEINVIMMVQGRATIDCSSYLYNLVVWLGQSRLERERRAIFGVTGAHCN